MGRAPTSGNCHTCRMRRVKCDRGKPECDRCIKAGYKCKGYETVLRIQSHSVVAGTKPGTARMTKIQTVSSFPAAVPGEEPMTTMKAKKQQARARQQAADAASSMQLVALPERPAHYSSSGSSSGRRSVSGRGDGSEGAASTRGSTVASSPPPELSMTGFVDDIAFSYFFRSYGWINMHSILLQDSSLRDTLQEGMAYDSLRALAYGLMGKDQHIQFLQAEGSRLYGSTLRKLRTQLSSPKKDVLAALIKPIAIMGSYLISVENDLRFTHHRGLSRILDFCGPEYFQSPSLLPIFESCRLTMISNCIVRRTTTFLSQDKWKHVPWAHAPHLKTWNSKLLDLMTEIPNLIAGVLNLMTARIEWVNAGFPMPCPEDPNEVPDMQRRVRIIVEGLADWRMGWEAAHPGTGSDILNWSFNLTTHDDYRPGVQGFAGPDLYNYSVMSSLQSQASPPPFLPSDQSTFTQMQDVALYTTVLIWTGRLTKYLAGAAMDHTNIDFYNTSFYTTCSCCTSKLGPLCDTVPDSDADVLTVAVDTDPDMSWNFNAARIAVAPIKVMESYDKPMPPIPVSPRPEDDKDYQMMLIQRAERGEMDGDGQGNRQNNDDNNNKNNSSSNDYNSNNNNSSSNNNGNNGNNYSNNNYNNNNYNYSNNSNSNNYSNNSSNYNNSTGFYSPPGSAGSGRGSHGYDRGFMAISAPPPPILAPPPNSLMMDGRPPLRQSGLVFPSYGDRYPGSDPAEPTPLCANAPALAAGEQQQPPSTPPGSPSPSLALLPSPPASAGFPRHVEGHNPRPPMLLPGDVRFSSQLRILGWLTDRLPATRPQVLSTLAAVGLGHCGHDVRPLEGLREVADVVKGALTRTNFEVAEHLMLRRYR